MSHISAIELLASQLKDLNEPVTEAQVMTPSGAFGFKMSTEWLTHLKPRL
jgi:hypothetical protein